MQPIRIASLVAALVLATFPCISWGQSRWWPIPPYVDAYHQQVYDNLVGEKAPEAWMIVRPSFRPEYAILILRKYQDGVPADQSRYMVESAVAHTSIWSAFEKKGYRASKVKIDRNSAEISYPDAQRFVDTWAAALKSVKYSDHEPGGLDGTDYDFYAKNRFGTTWSPEDGVPLAMAKDGDCLAQFVKAIDFNRPGILAECLKTAETLTHISTE